MTYDPNADRQYWRFSDSRRLIEAARDSGHELSIALGERLDAWLDAAIELADTQDMLRVVRAERDALLETVAQYEREADQ
jgi:predicted dehydrogenase